MAVAIEECCGILITNQNQIFRVDTSPTYRLQTLLSNLQHAFSLDFHNRYMYNSDSCGKLNNIKQHNNYGFKNIMLTYRSNHLFWTAIHNSSVFIWRSNLDDGTDAIPLIDTEARENEFNSKYYRHDHA